MYSQLLENLREHQALRDERERLKREKAQAIRELLDGNRYATPLAA